MRYDKHIEPADRIYGTPNYLAPEALIRGVKASPAVDIWAFGCILYGMAKGKPPFDVSILEKKNYS